MGVGRPSSGLAGATRRDVATRLHLRLFGDPALFRDEQPVTLGRRSRAILAYLALDAGHRASRERLCGLLWPDRADAQARASLRQCLAELRGAAHEVVGSDREWVWLEPESHGCDYVVLTAALTAGEARALLDALTAIGPVPLLDGLHVGEVFDDWALVTRASLDRKLGEGTVASVAGAIGDGDWSTALALADAWLARDPLDERVAALAIRAERLRAAPAAAQRRARALATALARDGLPPPGDAIADALDGPLFEATVVGTAAPPEPDPRPELPAKPSIAIMPLLDLSDAASGQVFAGGLAEEISLALSRFSSLFVVAGRSSLSPDSNAKPAQAIAAELGVRYLLEGSVRHAAGHVRITIRVIDAPRGQQIWSDGFDGELSDLLDLQDRVASEVASVIDSTITEAEMQRAASPQGSVASAYDLNLRANAKLNNYDRASIEAALALAEEAAALDPDYAWAAATAGFCHAALFMNQWSTDPPQSRAKAEAYIERAARLGRDDLMALPVTAGAILNISGNLSEARRLLDRALELNPEKAFTLFWAGWLELLSDRPDLALDRFEKARRLDPRSTYRPFQLTGIGNCLFLMDRFAAAEVVQREIVTLVPDYVPAQFVLAAALARLGRIDEAKRTLARARRRVSRDPVVFPVPRQQALLCEALALLRSEPGDSAEHLSMAIES
jgi:TolB-like protein/DNA-binding SARP family transcriptional activator/Tfp pilus assembly protein PilF